MFEWTALQQEKPTTTTESNQMVYQILCVFWRSILLSHGRGVIVLMWFSKSGHFSRSFCFCCSSLNCELGLFYRFSGCEIGCVVFVACFVSFTPSTVEIGRWPAWNVQNAIVSRVCVSAAYSRVFNQHNRMQENRKHIYQIPCSVRFLRWWCFFFFAHRFFNGIWAWHAVAATAAAQSHHC